MFTYCPNCASPDIIFPNEQYLECKKCHFLYYHNVASAVAVLLYQHGKILFVERNQEPKKGMLDLPGGFVNFDETAEKSAIREIKEELFIELEKDKLQYIASCPNAYYYKNINYRTLDIFFEYHITQPLHEFNTEEIKKLVWIPINEIEIKDLAFNSMQRLFNEYKNRVGWE